jgi:hypothetical protein
MLAMLIGAAIAAIIIKFKPHLLLKAALAVVALYYSITYFEIYSLFFVYNEMPYAALGGVFVYFVSRLYSVVLAPLFFGKWPKFKDYYNLPGKVVDTNTHTHHQVTAHIGKGWLGNDTLELNHRSTDYNTLSIEHSDGRVTKITGRGLNDQASVGQEVALGGANGRYHFTLYNKNQNRFYGHKPVSKPVAFLYGVFAGIPGLGAAISAIYFVFGSKYLGSGMNARYASNHMEFERRHVRFQFLYLVCLPFIAAIFLSGPAFIAAAVVAPMIISVTHAMVWRQDYARFEDFLHTQLVFKSHAPAMTHPDA